MSDLDPWDDPPDYGVLYKNLTRQIEVNDGAVVVGRKQCRRHAKSFLKSLGWPVAIIAYHYFFNVPFVWLSWVAIGIWGVAALLDVFWFTICLIALVQILKANNKLRLVRDRFAAGEEP